MKLENKRNNIRLPFGEKRKIGSGEWIYRHRVGLLATIAVYLMIMIAFVTYKILIKPIPVAKMQIELVPNEIVKPPEEVKKEMEQLEAMENIKVANKVSNENSKLDASLRDDRKSNTQEIYEEAERIKHELKSGQEAYEKGLAEIAAMQKKKSRTKAEENASDAGKDKKRETAKVKGNVVVSYDLENRNDVYLHKPAYQCEGGGQVVVNITVNRNGKVIAASIAGATNTSDQCMLEMAIQAAKASTFNTSASAPEKQKGTITYLFVPQ